MHIGHIFWILMLVWFVFSLIRHFRPTVIGTYGVVADSAFYFVLFLLLGWHAFGAPIKG